MRPPESFLGQPIRDLQTMLRVLAKARYEDCPVIPDGIYSRHTAQAVADFQQEHGLPITGITDQSTWEAVFEAYVPAHINLTPAAPLFLLLNPNQIIRKGERHSHLYVVQGMLAVLSTIYVSVSFPAFSGLLDPVTSESITSFQRLCGLPETGSLDKITWKYLALQYPLAASIQDMREAPECSCRE